jgi:hypothetical protein
VVSTATRPEGVRWPLAPLLAASGLSRRDLAAEVGITPRSVARAAAEGLSDRSADRWAIRLGFHPLTVWGWDWVTAGLNADTLTVDQGAA